MPSRILQTIVSTLFLLVLFLVDKTSITSLWILIPAGILLAAAWTMGSLVNTYWYAKYPPKLNDYELNWVKRFVVFYQLMDEETQVNFCNLLAHEMKEKEFTSMAEKDLPEELKMMALAPAVRLNLLCTDKEASHYSRIIYYHCAFATPEQQYLHLSETQHEDGVIILASDALEAAYLKPANYFNTALYEWCNIFVKLNKIPDQFPIETSKAWEIILIILETDMKKLLTYVGQPELDLYALLCYCYVMYPESTDKNLPAFYLLMKKLIN